MTNPYTDILSPTPVLSLEERYPHLAGMKARVDHRGDPEYEHLRVRPGALSRRMAHRSWATPIARARTQADADRAAAQAGKSKAVSELETLRATAAKQAETMRDRMRRLRS